jgi:hypothetical protein
MTFIVIGFLTNTLISRLGSGVKSLLLFGPRSFLAFYRRARAAREHPGFGLVVEAGLGAGHGNLRGTI